MFGFSTFLIIDIIAITEVTHSKDWWHKKIGYPFFQFFLHERLVITKPKLHGSSLFKTAPGACQCCKEILLQPLAAYLAVNAPHMPLTRLPGRAHSSRKPQHAPRRHGLYQYVSARCPPTGRVFFALQAQFFRAPTTQCP